MVPFLLLLSEAEVSSSHACMFRESSSSSSHRSIIINIMPPMAQQHQQQQRLPRVNLQEFKARFLKILGPAKESHYSSLLARFLSFRLSKEELDRLVPSTIGKENVVLHNSFVRAIFTNATCAEPPAPPSSTFDPSKPLKGVRRKPSTPVSGGDDSPPSGSSGLQSGRSNGDGFGASPRKGRSGIRDRKAAERPSPLGNHRGEASTALLQGSEDEASRVLENGHYALADLSRPLQQSQSTIEHSNQDAWTSLPPAKRARSNDYQNYSDYPNYDGKSEADVPGADEEKEDEEDDQGTLWMPSQGRVPLGIPFCKPSAGGPAMAAAVCMPQGPITHSLLGYPLDGECNDTILPDPEALRQRMQQGVIIENGLDGCDADSPVIVREALEIYLQRILKTVIELMQSKRSTNKEAQGSPKDIGSAENTYSKGGVLRHGRLANGVLAGEERLSQGEEMATTNMVMPLDFYVAMELNKKLFGDNYPMLLEKALLRVFWEQ